MKKIDKISDIENKIHKQIISNMDKRPIEIRGMDIDNHIAIQQDTLLPFLYFNINYIFKKLYNEYFFLNLEIIVAPTDMNLCFVQCNSDFTVNDKFVTNEKLDIVFFVARGITENYKIPKYAENLVTCSREKFKLVDKIRKAETDELNEIIVSTNMLSVENTELYWGEVSSVINYIKKLKKPLTSQKKKKDYISVFTDDVILKIESIKENDLEVNLENEEIYDKFLDDQTPILDELEELYHEEECEEEGIIIKPKELVSELSEYISGQDLALKRLSLLSLMFFNETIEAKVENRVIPLLIGDTGCGKSYTLKMLSEELRLPCLNISSKDISESGWRGKTLESLFTNFFEQNSNKVIVDCDFPKLRSLVLIDEFDKIATSNGINSHKDEYTEGIQDSILGVLESKNFTIENKLTVLGKSYSQIDLSGCLFIFAGAFSDIEDILSLKSSKHRSRKKIIETISNDDLVKYGFKKELSGRISNIIAMNPMTKEIMIDILKNKKDNVIEYYTKFFTFNGYDTQFKDCFFEEIAERAIKQKTGIRAIKSEIFSLFESTLYELLNEDLDLSKNKKIIFDKSFVIGKNLNIKLV
jgi:ATP-dependent Clp protease ATP-binding subunit ClpX